MGARIARQSEAVDSRLDPGRPSGEELFLRLPGGAEVCCRNDLASVTTYVIAEQEDWLEPELGFLRRWVRPGMRVLDVGAGHGVYALSLARLVGPAGEVVAFEPCAAARARLERGILRNGLDNCRLVAAAVADRPGEALLFARPGSEVASLGTERGGGGARVRLTTLDAEWRRAGEPALDLVKIDVAGFETAVLDGAGRLLAATSPLLVLGIDGERRRLAEVEARLRRHGFALYRLLPGPGVLLPLGDEPISGFQLNVCAAKPDRAAALAREGRLVPCLGDPCHVEVTEALAGLAALPCWAAADPAGLGRRLAAGGGADPLARSLAHGLRSRVGSTARAMADRVLVARAPLAGEGCEALRLGALSALARCAAELGWRERALGAIGELQAALDRGGDREALPLLPAAAAFDGLPPGPARAEWLRVMAADALVTLHCHSTRFTRGEALAILDRWRHSPFFGAHLERRRQLLAIRLGLQAGLWASEPLRRAPGLNPWLLSD
jgi:FkbM family methyltransferase